MSFIMIGDHSRMNGSDWNRFEIDSQFQPRYRESIENWYYFIFSNLSIDHMDMRFTPLIVECWDGLVGKFLLLSENEDLKLNF